MNAFIFEITGRNYLVNPFSSDLGIVENVPVVNVDIAYDCRYSYQTYILIIRNTFFITYMQQNLIPQFIIRSGGVIVKYIPKIHCNDPTSGCHCISF